MSRIVRGASAAIGIVGFAAIAAVVETHGSVPGDGEALRGVHTAVGTSLDIVATSVARATDGWILAVAAAVTAAALAARWRWRDALVIVVVLGVVMAVNPIVKEAFERPRPAARAIPMDVSRWSFPSGHAANTAAVVGAAALVARSRAQRRVVWVAGGSALVAVAATQLVLGAHQPSDIAAGWLWAGSWACLVGTVTPGDRSPGSRGPARASDAGREAARPADPLQVPPDAAGSVRRSSRARTRGRTCPNRVVVVS